MSVTRSHKHSVKTVLYHALTLGIIAALFLYVLTVGANMSVQASLNHSLNASIPTQNAVS